MKSLLEQSRAAGYSEPLSREKNNALYERLVQGDQAARDEMIQGNMALVIVRVEAFLRECPHFTFFRDDLVSAGLVGLCEAVDMMQKKGRVKKPNPTGYIYTAIDNHLAKVADEESTIVVPHETQKLARQQGKPITPPRAVGLKATESCFSRLSTVDIAAGHELEDEIRACCRDEIDVKIVEMKSAGHTDSEIAKAVGMSSHSTITKRRKKLFERLKDRRPECRNEPKDHSYLARH